jgi:hypothetical protein
LLLVITWFYLAVPFVLRWITGEVPLSWSKTLTPNHRCRSILYNFRYNSMVPHPHSIATPNWASTNLSIRNSMMTWCNSRSYIHRPSHLLCYKRTTIRNNSIHSIRSMLLFCLLLSFLP